MTEKKTFIIAEMACSHEGDPALARKIIDAAGAAGADAIQFQIWKAGDMVVPRHPDLELLKRIELSAVQWTVLAHYVRSSFPGMEIIACVYERGIVDFCESIGVSAYKLHSSDLSNPYLVKHVAATGKRIDLSVGASTIEEIRTALEWIRETSSSQIWMMYGYQNFPTPTNAIHLDYMMKLRDLFQVPIGYQDHTGGDLEGAFWLPAAAVGMGVDVMEKHITHDRAFKGIDHQAALDPDEFVRFVAMVREIEAAKGSGRPRPFSAEELKYRKYSKKSLVAARDLPAGSFIGEGDLLFMRAEELGLPPDQAGRLVGRTARRDLAAFQLLREEDVE
jgi:sialic acid synthase SpsE